MAAVVVLFLVALAFAPSVGFLLFAICPLAFVILPLRPGVAVAVVADVLPVAVGWWRGGSTDRLVGHLVPISAVSIALSVWLGIWIDNVVRQSEQRADLIDELERSRAEVARLSHEAGVLAERTRLAGEIHDTLAQGLVSIITLMQAVDAELDRHPERVRRHVTLAARTARENLAEARALVTALAPTALDAGSLAESVRAQARRLAEETSVETTVHTGGDIRPLPIVVEVVIPRATQEALANVRKHAGAKRVELSLDYTTSAVRLTVRDDGAGFDPSRPVDGYGLVGMRRRAEQVSGVLTWEFLPPDVIERLTANNADGRFVPRTAARLIELLAGPEFVEPGVVSVAHWRADDAPRAWRSDCDRVAWLVEAELAAAGQTKSGAQPPPLFGDRDRELDALRRQLGHGRCEVVAHQEQLVGLLAVGRVHGELGRRQPEDEPAVAGVDVVIAEGVPEEGAVRLGIVTVDDHMNAIDHRAIIAARREAWGRLARPPPPPIPECGYGSGLGAGSSPRPT
jgi:signal transduction histidine kinase